MLTYNVPKTMLKCGLIFFFFFLCVCDFWKCCNIGPSFLFLSNFVEWNLFIVEYKCWKISPASCFSVKVAQTLLASLRISWLTWSAVKPLRHPDFNKTFNVFYKKGNI